MDKLSKDLIQLEKVNNLIKLHIEVFLGIGMISNVPYDYRNTAGFL